MNLIEASKFFGIPYSVLKHINNKEGISNPLTEQDVSHLSFYRYLWNDDMILKTALSKRNKKRRLAIIMTAGLSKPESYAYNRYYNTEKRLYLKQVVDELKYYYKLPTGIALNIARRMRAKVYNYRYFLNKNHNGKGGSSSP